ncbi:hypothetical protein AGMMS50256_31420 [Betaproteobacteria bacterium]|nr:hypothetical protein AGMMS50256_31420 [Betaproteobacteria bacterium]
MPKMEIPPFRCLTVCLLVLLVAGCETPQQKSAVSQQESASPPQQLSAAAAAANLAEAALQGIQANRRKAAASYAEAARLAASVDSALARQYREKQAKALSDLGYRNFDPKASGEAIELYRQLVSEIDRKSDVDAWAESQYNLGKALKREGDHLPYTAQREAGMVAAYREAVTAFREALKEFTRERVPLDWAKTQRALGSVLWELGLGTRDSGTAWLLESAEAYREVLKVYTRESAPTKWAEVQSDLGLVLRVLGEREPGTARLLEAVAAYHEALKVRTRESDPHAWANMQDSLGFALLSLGEREPGTARLIEAIAAYREALKERTREREVSRRKSAAQDWAMTQYKLGIALESLGTRERGTARLIEAVAAYHAAQEVDGGFKMKIEEKLGRIQALIEERSRSKK